MLKEHRQRILWGLFGSLSVLCGSYFLLFYTQTFISLTFLHKYLLHTHVWKMDLLLLLLPGYFAFIIFGSLILGWLMGIKIQAISKNFLNSSKAA